MPDKCPDCPAPSADMDGFIVSGPGGAPRSEGSGVSSPEGPFVREAPQTGPLLLKGKVSSSSPLPDVPEPGWAYEAAEAGTYGGVQATAGDLVWCAGVNPVRWAVLQSDSDDSGRDLVSVSASMDCESSSGQFSPYYPRSCQFYGYDYAGDEPVPVGAVYSVDGSALYFEWLLDAHQHAVVVLDGVPVDVPVFDAEAGSAYEGMADGRTVRLDLVSKTRASSRFHFSFDVSAQAIPVLSLTSTTASGETTVQEVDMSCLSGMYGRLDSLSASFGCGSGRWSSVWIPSSSVLAGSTVGIDVLPPGSYALSIDLPVTSSRFVFKGSDYDRLVAAVSTTCDIVLSLPYQGETLYYAAPADDVADFFNGNARVGAIRHFINSRMGFRLESRDELTSQDPGGPDIVCTFSIVSGGGDFLVLDSADAGGLVSSQIVDLSCLHADSFVGAWLSFSCQPAPGLSLELRRGDGTTGVQTADMSCLVPPVFDGTANGLVPASGAVQNYLLAGNGTWMRPATDAEIDAIFAE